MLQSIIEKLAIIFMLIGLLGIIILPRIVEFFVNGDIDTYISNSEDIRLTSYQYIGEKLSINYGFSNRKDVLIIKSSDTYYYLNYYRKNKNDYGAFLNTDKLRKGSPIFISVNRMEFQNHKGNNEDPIPVLNFAFNEGKYVWDKESYQYNVKTYYIREKTLNTQAYAPFLEYFMLIGLLMGLSYIKIKK